MTETKTKTRERDRSMEVGLREDAIVRLGTRDAGRGTRDASERANG